MADQTLKMDEMLNSNGSGFMSDAEMLEFLNRSDVVKGPKSQAVLNDLRSKSAMSDIERALAESTQKAIPIENDVCFDDRINQLSDEELGVYIDLMNIEQGDMGPDLDSEQNYNLLERILQTLGLGRSVDETRLMEGSTPEQIQEYINEKMQGTRGALGGMKDTVIDEVNKMKSNDTIMMLPSNPPKYKAVPNYSDAIPSVKMPDITPELSEEEKYLQGISREIRKNQSLRRDPSGNMDLL